jgi:hypothetical protein
LDELSGEEQIILRVGQVEVRSPDWHRDEVRAALAEHEANPTAARPWAEARAELEAKLRRR